MTDQKATVKKSKHSWGQMMTVHHGKHFSIPLHPEHTQKLSVLPHGKSMRIQDETGAQWKVHRHLNKIHFTSHGDGANSNKTVIDRSHFFSKVKAVKEDSMEEAFANKILSWRNNKRLRKKVENKLIDKRATAQNKFEKSAAKTRAYGAKFLAAKGDTKSIYAKYEKNATQNNKDYTEYSKLQKFGKKLSNWKRKTGTNMEQVELDENIVKKMSRAIDKFRGAPNQRARIIKKSEKKAKHFETTEHALHSQLAKSLLKPEHHHLVDKFHKKHGQHPHHLASAQIMLGLHGVRYHGDKTHTDENFRKEAGASKGDSPETVYQKHDDRKVEHARKHIAKAYGLNWEKDTHSKHSDHAIKLAKQARKAGDKETKHHLRGAVAMHHRKQDKITSKKGDWANGYLGGRDSSDFKGPLTKGGKTALRKQKRKKYGLDEQEQARIEEIAMDEGLGIEEVTNFGTAYLPKVNKGTKKTARKGQYKHGKIYDPKQNRPVKEEDEMEDQEQEMEAQTETTTDKYAQFISQQLKSSTASPFGTHNSDLKLPQPETQKESLDESKGHGKYVFGFDYDNDEKKSEAEADKLHKHFKKQGLKSKRGIDGTFGGIGVTVHGHPDKIHKALKSSKTDWHDASRSEVDERRED